MKVLEPGFPRRQWFLKRLLFFFSLNRQGSNRDQMTFPSGLTEESLMNELWVELKELPRDGAV